jgi:hypothetical protein
MRKYNGEVPWQRNLTRRPRSRGEDDSRTVRSRDRHGRSGAIVAVGHTGRCPASMRTTQGLGDDFLQESSPRRGIPNTAAGWVGVSARSALANSASECRSRGPKPKNGWMRRYLGVSDRSSLRRSACALRPIRPELAASDLRGFEGEGRVSAFFQGPRYALGLSCEGEKKRRSPAVAGRASGWCEDVIDPVSRPAGWQPARRFLPRSPPLNLLHCPGQSERRAKG